jgi:hypothetical protein
MIPSGHGTPPAAVHHPPVAAQAGSRPRSGPRARDADHGDNRPMTEQPSWPTTPPTYGSVVLREFTRRGRPPGCRAGGGPVHPPHRQPARASHRPAGAGVGPSAARPARRATAVFVRHHRCRVRQRRGRDRLGASGPVGRSRDGGLRGFPVAPRLRHRDQRVERADQVRVDHPRPVPGRAVHRAVERQLHPRCRSRRIPAGGPAAQLPGDRRHPADMLLYATTRPWPRSTATPATHPRHATPGHNQP